MMGKIFVLNGPSGVGKTTFLKELLSQNDTRNIHLLPRYTNRPPRLNEKEGFEYLFTTFQDMLKKLYANDIIHIEKWGNYYSAIESQVIEKTITSDYDGIILASTFGASRLCAIFGCNVISLYMWTGERSSLLDLRCIEPDSPEIIELKRRIRKRLIADEFSDFERESHTDDEFIEKRMLDNYVDIAAVSGKLRLGEDITVLPNIYDKLDTTISKFLSFWSKTKK
ncbi:MAG: hypothetical protein JW725_05130 [Candidatus Babeliaceae bacterium]|nr:hypothetical protein [Candidatus Babeliaceae bacterium]